ncbi:MAG: M20 family metallo-hydrolase [Desulfonatronovibrionaceae bacterium]
MDIVVSHIRNQKDKVVDLQQKLVSLVALGPDNGGRGEKSKADFLLTRLAESGFDEIIEVNAPDERADGGYRPNIIARNFGRNKNKTLWIISHMDVVPMGDAGLWESNPFELSIDGDLIYGRGVEDNHQGMVSSIIAAEAFRELDIQPEINFGLILVSDEETGNRFGLPYVLEHEPDVFSPDDLYLVPDFGTSDSKMLEVAEKSMLWLKISVTGRQCHASKPDQGINTLVACSDFIMRTSRLKDYFSDESELFNPPGSTFTPTKKEANVPNINTIPGHDVFYLDCRVLPNYDLEDVVEQVQKTGREIEKDHQVKVSVETVLREQAAPFTDPSCEIVTSLSRAVREVCNVDPVPQGIGGGTVAAFLRHRSCNAVVWSTLFGTAHQPNECSSITNTLNDAAVMALLASARQ